MNFQPTITPLGTPLLTCFLYRGYGYVVGVDGLMFQLDTHGDDPDLWCWRVLNQL